LKFENFAGLDLDLTDKYRLALNAFLKDVDHVGAIYERDKHGPELQRNMSPIAGRIAWVRQLYARIESPMNAFRKKPEILKVSPTYLNWIEPVMWRMSWSFN